ncbi:MAG: hypothetical protein Harvfovirus46_3 [Harvfovirus sp.]|uniref:BTB domain-containing protein n=1 Tax=Harvfovirus sp. TaxID=2487768 RepID=A0A3G5A379_9VIRU|nr:MAG: hypothetical protein Harvfovirus46_3 [Harvfovirus sp.]
MTESDEKLYEDDAGALLVKLFRLSLGDMEVITMDGTIKVDSNVLSLRSLYFRKMFKQDFAEKNEKKIYMQKYNSQVMMLFFSAIYYGRDYFDTGCNSDLLYTPVLAEKFELLELFHSHLLVNHYEEMIVSIKSDYGLNVVEITNLCEINPQISETIRKFCVERIMKLMETRLVKKFVSCFDDLIPGKNCRKVDDVGGYCCKHFKPLSSMEIMARYPHLKVQYAQTGLIEGQVRTTCILMNHTQTDLHQADWLFKDNCCEHGARADKTDVAVLLKSIPVGIRDEILEKLLSGD